jgi:hypothetical protein
MTREGEGWARSGDQAIARDRVIGLRPSADSWVDWVTLGGIGCT